MKTLIRGCAVRRLRQRHLAAQGKSNHCDLIKPLLLGLAFTTRGYARLIKTMQREKLEMCALCLGVSVAKIFRKAKLRNIKANKSKLSVFRKLYFFSPRRQIGRWRPARRSLFTLRSIATEDGGVGGCHLNQIKP
jgi:hypothetical protein